MRFNQAHSFGMRDICQLRIFLIYSESGGACVKYLMQWFLAVFFIHNNIIEFIITICFAKLQNMQVFSYCNIN